MAGEKKRKRGHFTDFPVSEDATLLKFLHRHPSVFGVNFAKIMIKCFDVLKNSVLQQWQCQLPETEFHLRHIQVSIATADPSADATKASCSIREAFWKYFRMFKFIA